jgi:hypothetical protein
LKLAAHQGHQTLADGQLQAGAAKTPRGRGLGLRKPGKDALLMLWRNANARVAHRHPHQHVVG